MPRRVAVRVRNWAMTKRTFEAMSLSSERSNETNVRMTATQKEAVAMVFSRRRRGCFIGLVVYTPPSAS